jgi:hemerythrin-like domain-containing protein
MKENALDVVYRTHTEGKEKALFTRDFVHKFSDENIFSKLQEIIEFFYRHIPVHFKYEEIVIDTLKNNFELDGNEKQLVEKILTEHDLMRNNFEKIKELTVKTKKGIAGMREKLIELVNDTLEILIKHAEIEDKSLFPLINSKLKDEHIEIIKKQIVKVVV